MGAGKTAIAVLTYAASGVTHATVCYATARKNAMAVSTNKERCNEHYYASRN
jgi:hypothetical protein